MSLRTFLFSVSFLVPLFAIADDLTVAVVVGISAYQDPAITDLSFAHRDAQVFAEFLTSPDGGNIGEDNVRLLTDSTATKASIEAAFVWQLSKLRDAQGRAIVYFAGHGDVEIADLGSTGYLLAHDTPKNNYHLLALSVDYLDQHLRQLTEAKNKVILITDACHAGSLAGNEQAGREITTRGLMRRSAEQVKIMSCQPYELAQEGRQWGRGRGVFSYYLIDGLRGAADGDRRGGVDLLELENYLQNTVREATGRKQHPAVAGGRMTENILRVDPDRQVRAAVTRTVGQDFLQRTIDAAKRQTQRSYVYFQRALARRNLLDGSESCAYAHYRELRGDSSLVAIRGILDEQMIVPLLDSVQQAIRGYLETDAAELAQREFLDDKYRAFPRFLAAAAEIVGREDPRYRSILAKQLYFEGVVLRLEGERGGGDSLFGKALDRVSQAIELEPEAAYLHNEMGLLRAQLGAFDAAYFRFDQATDLAPTWALPYNNLGSIYRGYGGLKNLGYASYYYEKAVALKPDFATAQMNYGNLFEALGKSDSAEVYLRRAIALGPEYLDAYYNLATVIVLQPNRYAEAESLFRRVIATDSSYALAYAGLGKAHRAAGRLDSARLAFLRAIAIDPTVSTAYAQLATMNGAGDSWKELLLRVKLTKSQRASLGSQIAVRIDADRHPAKAEEALRLATKLGPNRPEAYLDLSSYYARKGKLRPALKSLVRSLKLARKQNRETGFCEWLAGATDFEPYREEKAFLKAQQKFCSQLSENE